MCVSALQCPTGRAQANRHKQTNRVADTTGLASHPDGKLLNPRALPFLHSNTGNFPLAVNFRSGKVEVYAPAFITQVLGVSVFSDPACEQFQLARICLDTRHLESTP